MTFDGLTEKTIQTYTALRRFVARHSEGFVFSSIYLFLAFLDTRVKLMATPAWTSGRLVRNHHRLLDFNYYNNEQSRLLQWAIPEGFHRLLGLSIENAYLLQRLLFTWLALFLFHLYLRRWFKPSTSFAGVLFLAAIMPFTHTNDLQESASLLLVTFLLALWAMREHKDTWTTGVFFVGGLNNETMLSLPLVHLFCNWRGWSLRQIAFSLWRTALVSLPMVVAIGFIRYLTRNRPHLGGAWHWPDNLERIGTALTAHPFAQFTEKGLYPFFIFGMLWFFAYWRFKHLPSFMRCSLLMIPFFIFCHLITGIFSEVRQMVPLAFILVPAAFFYLFREEEENKRPSIKTKE